MKVNITVNKDDTLKLRFTVAGKRFTFRDKLYNTPEGLARAEIISKRIQVDVLAGCFDVSLDKYKHRSRLEMAIKAQDKGLTIQVLWGKYVEYRTPSVSPSTLLKQFGPITNYLNKLPRFYAKDAVKLRNQINKDKSAHGSKRLLMQLNAMGKWALASELLPENPFEGMASTVKVKQDNESDLNPFTKEERDLIIKTFETNRYSHYASLVKFLFFTGCRSSEALGLRFKRIYPDRVRFDSVLVSGLENKQAKPRLKTQPYRDVPVNDQLSAILREIKSKDSDDLVFKATTGNPVNWSSFRTNAWKKTLASLGIEYRKPYQTRHTFITLCLEQGIDAKDIAAWVGNTPEMIYKHYAAASRDLAIPAL